MRKAITVLSLLAFVGVASGCSSEHVTRQQTTRESVTVPADPTVTEHSTTTHTETHY
ncbi:MAG TPA: hypothetical protein VGK20_08725 [Candidatus Binatia bacterium]|jgi:hypothetical protein